ncbi:MMPL family transporter [Tumebacillus lipolyticus]|uniref:MMPL family transporter n=1 Tax=Tumebacillus lipolyticus TaxID=1280370 RepID=A0ABW4ZUY9_9BACL
MTQLLRAVTAFSSRKKGAIIMLALWIALVLILSAFAPTSKMFAVNSNASDLPADVPSELARQAIDQHFPADGGLTALLVFHDDRPLSDDQQQQIVNFSRGLVEDKPEGVEQSLPIHQMPPSSWEPFFSADHTTLMLPVHLDKGLDSHQVRDAVKAIDQRADALREQLHISITGPAGIASDALAVFQNADLVLMLSTVALILVLMIVLYRSPLLAIVPLLVAGLSYAVVDRLLGLAGKNDWFVVDSQALSIMMILLFAVLTDYCLFVFSRYREELRNCASQFEAMRVAMNYVGEPIFFSSSTIFVSVLTLAAALFKPYQHFAPVFATALIVILLSGLTLIPAVFTLLGRKAFWPFVPKVGETKQEGRSFWAKLGRFNIRKPRTIVAVLMLLLVGASLFTTDIKYSFNLLQSFPEDSSSRIGFETLERQFPKGSLAPVTAVVESTQEIQPDQRLYNALGKIAAQLASVQGVESVTPDLTADNQQETGRQLPKGVLSEDRQAIQLQMVLADDPYGTEAMQTIETLRQQAEQIITDSGLELSSYRLHFAGQTPQMVDTRDINDRDTLLVVTVVIAVITLLLIFQSRSLIAPLYMIGTILLTYGTALGLGWLIFHELLGYEAISYRIPLYSFVFLVALGVDYNILLLSRVREEAQKHELPQAIARAVALTGKTISSAGLILVATFAVLMTQPLLELFMFGFVVALGVLIDTFLVRALLMPSIMVLLGRFNWWPTASSRKMNTITHGIGGER